MIGCDEVYSYIKKKEAEEEKEEGNDSGGVAGASRVDGGPRDSAQSA